MKDQSWTANTDFNDGNRAKDKADYAYDKSFDTEDTKTGGVVISQDNKVNNIDNDYDRAYVRCSHTHMNKHAHTRKRIR